MELKHNNFKEYLAQSMYGEKKAFSVAKKIIGADRLRAVYFRDEFLTKDEIKKLKARI